MSTRTPLTLVAAAAMHLTLAHAHAAVVDNSSGAFAWRACPIVILRDGLCDWLDVTQGTSQSGSAVGHGLRYLDVSEYDGDTFALIQRVQEVFSGPRAFVAAGDPIVIQDVPWLPSVTPARPMGYGEWVGASEVYLPRGVVMYASPAATVAPLRLFLGEHAFLGVLVILDDLPHFGWVELEAQRDANGGFERYIATRWAYSGEPDEPLPTPASPADIDASGCVGLSDLTLLLSDFGTAGVGRRFTDTDRDGDVDLADLARLLADFGVGEC